MRKTAEMIIEEDIRKVYLGNLNTVEFDLELPSKGENGSSITWKSDNELFLRPDGGVTRPWNGIGDRKVNLHGLFEYNGVVKEKVYEVHILEEPPAGLLPPVPWAPLQVAAEEVHPRHREEELLLGRGRAAYGRVPEILRHPWLLLQERPRRRRDQVRRAGRPGQPAPGEVLGELLPD